MKRIYYILKISLFLLFVTITLNSCSKDKDPENPIITDPTEFVWSKLEVRFTKGHSHGYFHGNPDYPVKYLKTVQHFYFNNVNGVPTPAANNPTAIRWEGADVVEDHHDDEDEDHHHHSNQGVSLYGIELIFYDASGKRINTMLSTGNNPNHYQFFFVANNFVAVASNTTVPTCTSKGEQELIKIQTPLKEYFAKNR